MVAKVVGVQSVDFTDKDGKPVQGAKVHFIRDIVPDESAYIVGQVADTLFIRADSPLISTVLFYSERGFYCEQVEEPQPGKAFCF